MVGRLVCLEPSTVTPKGMEYSDLVVCRGYSSQWDVFFDQIQPLTTKMPYMTVPGNHERDWPNSGDRFPAQYDSGGECGVPYNRRLKMPTPAEDKPWYSFDFGPIHFLQYSTEHDFAQGACFSGLIWGLQGIDNM